MENVIAPIDANVWKINVAVGDVVEIDDEVVILEALKMETPVYASEDGTVVKIEVKEGDKVNGGQVLVVID
ncbi:hypothetical protein JCM17380_35240 [Desulfosporosinus burensis]